MAVASRTEFDPVTLEILWSRLISIADESAAALVRTSFSTIVRERAIFGGQTPAPIPLRLAPSRA
jgi:hypothetical protein